MPRTSFLNLPLLETARLDLRPFSPGDADLLWAFNTNDMALAYVAREPWQEREQATLRCREFRQGFADGTACWWVFVARESGDRVGYGGLFDLDDSGRIAELGYGLMPAWWGRGLAGEAVPAMVSCGFSDLGLHRIGARVHAGNVASERILQRIGFTREGRRKDDVFARGRYFDTILFGMINPRHL